MESNNNQQKTEEELDMDAIHRASEAHMSVGTGPVGVTDPLGTGPVGRPTHPVGPAGNAPNGRKISSVDTTPAVLSITDLNADVRVTIPGSEAGQMVQGIRLSDQVGALNATQADGFTIKQKSVLRKVSQLHKKLWKELMLAVLRNVLYWIAVICILIMLANAKTFNDWSSGSISVVIMFFAVGLLGAGFHVAFVVSELSPDSPVSVLGSMLYCPCSRDEFQQLMVDRQLSAPEIFFELSLRSSGGISTSDNTHWTRVSRKLRKEMTYRGWADQSSSVQSIPWPAGKPSWIIVAKDFRCVDPGSQLTMDREANEFRRENGVDNKNYFLSFDISLQWKEHDSCPDAQTFLVFDEAKPTFYHIIVYKCALFLGLDAVYRVAFHILVKQLNDYFIVKFIEK